MSRILIIEDEEAIADLEKDYLELSGFEVEIENRGDTGLVRAMKEEFDLIILDLMLPEVDGFDICRQVREEKNTPIIMVSAKKDDIDKIRGLGLGADDYMTKPFSPSELVARVKAHMERYNRLVGSNVHKNDVIEIRGIKIDKTARRVWVNGEEITSGWTADRTAGSVTFGTAPEAPAAGQEDNVRIQYPHTVSGYADRIKKCTIITAYGINATNRIVLSGNPEHPNLDWTSAVNDPTYIPDLSYSAVGLEGVRIMGYCRIGEYLGIVKEENAQDSSVWIRKGTLDSDGKAVFTVQAALAGVGAVSTGCFANLLDEPMFVSGTGIYALASSSYASGRVTQNRSWYLNAMLTEERGLADCAAVQWSGMYLLAVGGGVVYVLDGRQERSYRRASNSDYIYEGYYWDGIPAACWMVRKDGADEHLYFGTDDGRICRFSSDWDDMRRFSDDGKAIEAIWATRVDDDGDATVLKTMIKRGASVTIKPHQKTSATVYVVKDEDAEKLVASGYRSIFNWDDIDFTDFTFETYDGPTDIMLNTKVKKYKRLQIIVVNHENEQGFGVFAITKHYVAGNFAKR